MEATLANCSYANDNAVTLGEQLTNSDFALNVIYGIQACTPLKWQYLVNLLCVVLWLIVARWMYDFYMRFRRRGKEPAFRLAEELTKRDNPALAIDFASFLLSICIITRGSLDGLQPGIDDARYFGSFFAYQAIGCVVLTITRILNDKLMLRKVKNVDAMIEDRSIAVGCVEGGQTVATAIIFSASASGGGPFGEGVALTLLYWLFGQIVLIVYGNVVDCVTALPIVSALNTELVKKKAPTTSTTSSEGGESSGAETTDDGATASQKATSVFTEAANGNVAAGLSAGMDMLHAGILIAAPIYVGYEVLAFVIFVSLTLGVVSPVMHLYLDHIVLRGAGYSINILRHKNWGAAALLGSLKVLTSLVLMMSYKENCEPATLYTDCLVKAPDNFAERLGAVSVPNVFSYQVLLNLLILLFLMVFAKLVFFIRFAVKDGISNVRESLRIFSLDKTLADPKNNAVAVSLACYTFAQGQTMVGVVYCPNANAGMHGAEVLMWTAIGCVLLMLAFEINDCVLLRKISNTESLVRDNVAVACYEGGSFLSCGLILRATLTGGGDYSAGEGLALTAIFWALGQLLLLLFAYAYRCFTFYDDYTELKEGNVAAGLSGGMSLVSLAVVLSFPMMYYVSLIIVLPIAVIGIIALMILRQLVDVFILPGDRLDREIKNDKNWGAALVEGCVGVGVALISNMYVPPPGAPFVSNDVDYFDICE